MISGGSKTAVYLAKMLLEMGMYVKIIEINEERCKELSEALPDAVIINGDVSNQELLYEENIEEFDSFISLNNIDEENIVHSMFAKGIDVPNVITKVNHINLDGVIEKADIDTIVTPHKIASNQIVRYVRAMSNSLDSSCESIYKFDDEDFEMIEFNVKQGFKGLNIKLKDLKIKDKILVVAILRGKDIIFPAGNDEIKVKDTIVLAVDDNRTIKDLNNILE
jgi:trk system potassium uptake protein TrkA